MYRGRRDHPGGNPGRPLRLCAQDEYAHGGVDYRGQDKSHSDGRIRQCDLRPKIEVIAENLSQTTTVVRSQVQRLDATVNDIIDRTRLQVIRADELVNRTLDKVEETTEIVHHTVVSPIRQVAGLVQGLSAGLQYFLGRRRTNRAREAMGVPQDELFI